MSNAALVKLRDWYQAREPREQQVLLWGGIAALAILLFGSLWQLDSSVDRARADVERKRLDLAFMQAASAEIIAAGPVRMAANTGEPLVVIVDRAARESGLAQALGASEGVPPDGLRVRFNAAPFDALVAMTARLAQQHGVSVSTASVERAAEPGSVNATFTLRSSASPSGPR
jgi:general secretion pathway protein M